MSSLCKKIIYGGIIAGIIGAFIFFSYGMGPFGGVSLLLGFFAPAGIIVLYFKLKTKRELRTAKEMQASVKVITKTTQISGTRFSTGTSYYVSFEFSDGDRINFPANISLYNTVVENDEGMLTYKEFPDGGLIFVDFQRTSNPPQMKDSNVAD